MYVCLPSISDDEAVLSITISETPMPALLSFELSMMYTAHSFACVPALENDPLDPYRCLELRMEDPQESQPERWHMPSYHSHMHKRAHPMHAGTHMHETFH